MTIYCSKHCTRPILGSCPDCAKLVEKERRKKRLAWVWWVVRRPWRALRRKPSRVFRILEVLGIVAGIYLTVYTVMLARHELRLNRATYERSAFIDLVTSGNRGAFIAAMQNFGPVQTMEVPPEPYLFPPWNWWAKPDKSPEYLPMRHYDVWWPKPTQLNMKPLYLWALNFFPLCTPQLCGEPDGAEPNNPAKGIRIFLRGANLYMANLPGVDLHGAELSGADLRGGDLHGAELNDANLTATLLHEADFRMADLRGIKGYAPGHLPTVFFWDNLTKWPDGFTRPCPQNTRDNPCNIKK